MGDHGFGKKVELPEGHDAPWLEMLNQVPKCTGWIRDVEQNEPSHQGVEIIAGNAFAKVSSMEGDVGETGRFGAGRGGLEYTGVLVHTEDAARRTDELSGEQGHVPGPASYVEDVHALCDAGVLEQASRKAAVELVLRHQAPRLGLAAAHQVGG